MIHASQTLPQDQWSVIGLGTPYEVTEPSLLFVVSDSTDERVVVTIKGLGEDGNRVSEFVSVVGTEPVLTKTSFAHIDSASVNGKQKNKGNIFFHGANNKVLLCIKKGESYSQKAAVHVRDKALVQWSVSLTGDIQASDADVRLFLYQGEKRQLLHELSVSPQSLNAWMELREPLPLKEGILVAEGFPRGSKAKVYVTMEFMGVE